MRNVFIYNVYTTHAIDWRIYCCPFSSKCYFRETDVLNCILKSWSALCDPWSLIKATKYLILLFICGIFPILHFIPLVNLVRLYYSFWYWGLHYCIYMARDSVVAYYLTIIFCVVCVRVVGCIGMLYAIANSIAVLWYKRIINMIGSVSVLLLYQCVSECQSCKFYCNLIF